ncbi:hypothetical protein GSI_11738 [Ganoderma sinense ZZ0214-1]|uniref:Uncharacterized protein n=1 Tax=Ganoderma sinense ZZ0214-1 TaxID=1077348 RepID=A0A2G8RWX4_9APHY|nr:hypothetical protein GSI_11738 [Ganoderma sinense ZZ0214-1]
MSYPVNYANLLSVSSALWLGAGGIGKGSRHDSDPSAKVVKKIFQTLFKIPQPPIKIDTVPDTPPSPPPPNPPVRPALVRACTSATLLDTDFLSDALPPIVSPCIVEFRFKSSTDGPVVDRLRNHLSARPAPPVEDGNLGQEAPVVNVAAPPPKPKVRRGKKKRTTRKKRIVRWTADVIEREIQANRPVTGHERLERFRRLGYSV